MNKMCYLVARWRLNRFVILGFTIVLLMLTSRMVIAENHANKEDLKKPVNIEDLAYGNILFEYYRGKPIEALNAILVAQEKQLLPNHRQNARLLAGVIYLDLGMLSHSQQIFNDLLSEKDLKSELLAKLEFYLGKLHYQQGDYEQAEWRLERVITSLQGSLKDECLIMLSNMELYKDQKVKARDWLALVSEDSELAAFSRFNLGISWLRESNISNAQAVLNQINPADSADKVIKALQDKAKLALGYSYLSKKQFDKAREQFLQVRLNSPQANKALLGTGWSYLESGSYKKALSHWLELGNRDIRDIAVQEALLAIPYAYQKLDAMQLSLQYYVAAAETFQQQISLIKELSERVNEGSLLEKFVDKIVSTQLDLIDDSGIQDSKLFGDKYDYYLFELISQHQFNENFRSYQKLGKLANILTHWELQLPIFDEILKANQIRFEEKIPLVEQYLKTGSFDEYQQLLTQFETDLADLKADRKHYLLADEQQLAIHQRIERMMEKISQIPEDLLSAAQKLKAQRAVGVLQWQLESGKAGKIWNIEKNAIQIRRILAEMDTRKLALGNAREKAQIRFLGAQEKVGVGTAKLLGLKEKIREQIKSQANELKSQIIAVLQRRRATLDHYLLQADLSIARMHEQAIEIPEFE